MFLVPSSKNKLRIERRIHFRMPCHHRLGCPRNRYSALLRKKEQIYQGDISGSWNSHEASSRPMLSAQPEGLARNENTTDGPLAQANQDLSCQDAGAVSFGRAEKEKKNPAFAPDGMPWGV
jgi:hypothetical protein